MWAPERGGAGRACVDCRRRPGVGGTSPVGVAGVVVGACEVEETSVGGF